MTTVDLSRLEEVALDDDRAQRLERLLAASRGTPVWMARKRTELRELLALEQVAPRLEILRLDATRDVLALVRLRGAAPLKLGPSEPLVVARSADLAIVYPEDVLRTALPGLALVQIRSPRGVFSANVSADSAQRLCLGTRFPVGIPLREIVLGAYAALTMQSVMIDTEDPAGVMNAEAARWWQSNRDLVPLSSVPFLATDDLCGGGDA